MASPKPLNAGSPADAADHERRSLRRRLLVERERFATLPAAAVSHDGLTTHLLHLLRQTEPERLGVYWPVRGEFNAIGALEASGLAKLPLALPFVRRQPPAMHYRAWHGGRPTGIDECGLPAPGDGPAVVPDVVLVPCVGYTRSGFRLGYGGGYFDRWLAQHPQVLAVGVAWSLGEVADEAFGAQAHDVPLTAVLTERGVVDRPCCGARPACPPRPQ